MNIELLREYCIKLNNVTEEFPFDNDTLVFKVVGKIFALISLSSAVSVNVKVDPEKVESLRERFHAVKPGYHMSKKHWNTVTFNEDVNDKLLMQMVLESYTLVVMGLPKKVQTSLNQK
jgi:predicted DNA-binding protein (MmcQ/YjbR family)